MARVFEAIVRDVEDPEQRGRIRIASTELLGSDQVFPQWAEPNFPYAGPGVGWFFVPPPDSIVICEIDVDRDPNGLDFDVLGAQLRWRAASYSDSSEIPEDIRGKGLQGIVTPAGAMVFDGNASRLVLRFATICLGSKDATEAGVLGTTLKAALDALVDLVQNAVLVVSIPDLNAKFPPGMFAPWQASYTTSNAILSKKVKLE